MNDAKEKFLWLTLDVFFPKKKCRIATFSKEFNNIFFAPNKPILKKDNSKGMQTSEIT